MKKRTSLVLILIPFLIAGCSYFRRSSGRRHKESSDQISESSDSFSDWFSSKKSSSSTKTSQSSSSSSSIEDSSSVDTPNEQGYLFNSFSELAYYSYLPKKNIYTDAKPKQVLEGTTYDDDDRDTYVDERDRTHYPIPYNDTFTFSDFLFFDFYSYDDNAFLGERIGNGHIKGLVVQTNIFSEEMIILKNGNNYYSCLLDGASRTYKTFSAHKYIEGFDLIKDMSKKGLTITIYFDENNYNPSNILSINIDNSYYSINHDAVLYDDTEIRCSVEGLIECLNNVPMDAIALTIGDSNNLRDSDGNTIFYLNEFGDVPFKVTSKNSISPNSLYYGEFLISEGNLSTSLIIYASDINGDGYRELVFDRKNKDNENRGDYFVVYDVIRRNVLLDEADVRVDYYSQYHFNYELRDDKLTFLPYLGNFSENSIVDYGYLRLSAAGDLYFDWQNIYAINSIKLVDFYLDNNEQTLVVPNSEALYTFKIGTTYIMEVKVDRNNYDKDLNCDFLSLNYDNYTNTHLERFEPLRNQSDIQTGTYKIRLSVLDVCDNWYWEFFFGEFAFKVIFQVVA